MKRKDVISFFCIVSYMFIIFGGMHLYVDDCEPCDSIRNHKNTVSSLCEDGRKQYAWNGIYDDNIQITID